MGSALLVCSGGGHLKQLFTLVERIGIPPEDQLWVTFRNGLSESLLAGREVVYAPFTAPRDLVNFGKLLLLAQQVTTRRAFDVAISTGSSPALAFLPLAARRGASAHYIESAARADGPSRTGTLIAAHFPGVNTYTQYPSWADDRWLYRGSIYDAFSTGPTAVVRDASIRRAVVSVGTQEGFTFDRLFKTLVPLLADCEEVMWQSGDQDLSEYHITGRPSVPHDELKSAVSDADVVIAHAGTGAALTALEQGKCPILVPRLARFGEHIDDHQVQIGREMDRRGLALFRSADDILHADLVEAASRNTVKVLPPPLLLEPARLARGSRLSAEQRIASRSA
ncbi:glycosyltransferase [soil metagenome]